MRAETQKRKNVQQEKALLKIEALLFNGVFVLVINQLQILDRNNTALKL